MPSDPIKEWRERHAKKNKPIIGELWWHAPKQEGAKAYFVGSIIVGKKRIYVNIYMNNQKRIAADPDYWVVKISGERLHKRSENYGSNAQYLTRKKSQPEWDGENRLG